MGASRTLGALLCIVCVVIAVSEIYFVFIAPHEPVPLAISLPVVLGVLVITGLGFWLGWIMVTTKEVTPPAAPSPPSGSAEEKVLKAEEE